LLSYPAAGESQEGAGDEQQDVDKTLMRIFVGYGCESSEENAGEGRERAVEQLVMPSDPGGYESGEDGTGGPGD
jgi:hypothetical protein